MSETARTLDCSEANVRFFARRHFWKTRVAGYDTHLQRLQDGRSAVRKLEAAERHAVVGREFVKVSTLAVGKLKPKDLDAHAIAKLARTGVEIERLALGETSDGRAASTQAPDVNVAIIWGDNKPAWINAKVNGEKESTSTVGEQVIAGTLPAPLARARLSAKISKSNLRRGKTPHAR